jgi:exonuclease SbcC
MMANIRLRELEVEGFRSYHDKCRVVFSDGVNVIVGRNGAGKTTLVEAIYFALSSKTMRGNIEDLYNARSRKPIHVRLVLESDKGEIKIERERPNTMGDKLILNNGVQAIGARSVDSRIAEVLGLGRIAELSGGLPKILKTAFVSQGELLEYADMLSSGGKDKKEWIDTQLGLRDYEEAYRKLGEYSVKARVDNRERRYKVSEDDYKLLLDDISSTETKLREKERELKEKENELAATKSELAKKQSQKEELEKKIAEIKESLKRIEDKKRRFDELSSTKRTLGEELSRKKSMLKEKEAMLSELTRKGVNDELAKALLVIKEAVSLRMETEATMNALEESMKLLEEGLALIDELRKMNVSLEPGLTALREEYTKALHSMKRSIQDVGKLKERLEKEKLELEELLSQAIQLISSTIGGVASPSSIEEAAIIIDNAYRNVLSTLTRSEFEAKQLEDKIASLSKASGFCPVCGAPLTEEHRAKLVEEAKAQLQRVLKALDESRRVRSQLEEITVRINSKINTVKNLMERLDELSAEQARIKERYGDLERMEKIASVIDGLLSAQSKLKGLLRVDVLKQLGLDEASISAERFPEVHRAVSAAMDELAGKLSEASRKLEEALATLSGDLSLTIREKLSTREASKALISSLEQLVNEYLRLRSELAGLSEEVVYMEQKLASIEQELAQLHYDEKEYDEARKAFEEEQRRYTQVHGDIQRLEERARNLEALIADKKTEIESLRKSLSELTEARTKLSVLLKARSMYHRDGIPSKLRAYALGKINEEFNSLLQMFNLGFREALIDEDLNIVLRSSSASLPASQLSGGEKIVVALSFLLALRKTVEELLVGRRIFGFLVLDEPTIHLDEDRRTGLIELLKEFQGGRVIPQLIIVTHEEDLKESADNTIHVENNGLTSTAKILMED